MRGALCRGALLSAVLLLPASGCGAGDAFAEFSGSANAVLVASVPVFRDLGGSCLRVKALESGIGTFAVVRSDPGCEAIGKQAEGAVAAAEILAAYFNAINALASVGVARSAAPVTGLASQAAAVVSANPAAQGALGAMAQFLTTAAIGSHRARAVGKDLGEVNRNVGAVTDALAEVVRTNYLHQELADEERKLAVQYKEFAQTHTDGAVTLQLDERWRADERDLAGKRAAAESLIVALDAIKLGVASVAADAGTMRGKDVPRLLRPYVAELQTLLPQIQKGF